MKRLLTFCQRAFPTDPSRSVDFDSFRDAGRGAAGAGSDKRVRRDGAFPACTPAHLRLEPVMQRSSLLPSAHAPCCALNVSHPCVCVGAAGGRAHRADLEAAGPASGTTLP